MSRTTVEVAIPSGKVDKVLAMVAAELEPSGFRQKIVDGETVWAKEEFGSSNIVCFAVVFSGASAIIQGWYKRAFLGEVELVAFQKRFMKRILRDLQEEIQLGRL